jgi:hypothetical protein
MGGIKQPLGQADPPTQLANKLDQLLVGVGDGRAANGGAVEQIEPHPLGAGRVHVDDVGALEVRLEPAETKQQVKDR